MVNLILRMVVVFAVAVLVCASSVVVADEASAGREVISNWGKAVVTVQVVLKMGMSFGPGGTNEESKSEITGTVIDPSGLTVVSLTATSPSESLQQILGEEESALRISSEVTDLKIRTADGKEIPAKFVLRDRELDLAFLRPSQKIETPLAAIDLKASGPADILDQLLILSRMGKVANRTIGAGFSRVQAVIDKPRKLYALNWSNVESGFGSPAFGMDGKIVGILLVRKIPSQSVGFGNMFGGWSDMGMLPVIVPAADIAEVAAQAPEEELK